MIVAFIVEALFFIQSSLVSLVFPSFLGSIAAMFHFSLLHALYRFLHFSLLLFFEISFLNELIFIYLQQWIIHGYSENELFHFTKAIGLMLSVYFQFRIFVDVSRILNTASFIYDWTKLAVLPRFRNASYCYHHDIQ